MANRSYVYSVDAAPTKTKRPKPIRGLSEFNWDIPLAHRILASGSPKRCRSVIWPEYEIGVVADYATGTKRLLAFLAALAPAVKKTRKEFDAAVAETKNVLSSAKSKGKLILLEAGEIFDMDDGDLVESAKRLVDKDIPATAKKVDAVLAGKEAKWLAEVAKTWEDKLGLYWSDVLYFDPGGHE